MVLRGLTAATAAATAEQIRERVVHYIEQSRQLEAGDVFVAPLVTAAAELGEENMIRLVRLRYSTQDTNDNSAPDRIH